jgi:hypothetical protein
VGFPWNFPSLLFWTQILSLYIPQESGVTERPLTLPGDRTHKPDNEDVIIGFIWKIIDIVHSACFEDFKLNSPSTQFDYFIAIENVLLQTPVQKRWSAFSINHESDIQTLFIHLDEIF